jgi:hypothetical protein
MVVAKKEIIIRRLTILIMIMEIKRDEIKDLFDFIINIVLMADSAEEKS